ncbi:lycopene cyclase family protein [Nocardia jiangsuensis]|uniref:Lycopene cyclase family protein n=1 Tax=Nocardia jiangsuensis TaxID=1691563 RepID=A0ABV8DYG4_9NOCA
MADSAHGPFDVVVCGQGPAGRALAHRCLAHGRTVAVVDPAPERRWRATYAVWADELPDWLDRAVVAATVPEPVAWGRIEHRLDRAYAVLDTGRLQRALAPAGAAVFADRATRLTPHGVTLASGAELRGERVIDARGLRRDPARAEQTAHGVLVPADRVRGTETLFMDWRGDNGADPAAPPSFLYAVPLGPDTVLLEETCLAGRPALDDAELRRRLHHRLAARDIPLTGAEEIERVRFPVQGGQPGPERFGAAGGLLHPATGYSVAAALAAADTVATGGTLWTPRARAVAALRAAGLRALLALPPERVPDFFDAFFTLPPQRQRAYLSGPDDLAGVLAAMAGLFPQLPRRTRLAVARATLDLRVRSQRPGGSAMME